MSSLPAGPSPAITSIAQVIERMQGLEAALPAGDGVASFNRMYLGVTQEVNEQVQASGFGDLDFMRQLDVVFARRYFAAVDAMAGPLSQTPVCWAPLFAARSTAGIEPVQFALAGMNAHINFDLPMAVVAACVELNTEPDAGSHYDDYAKVDSLLDAAEQSVRQSFESPDIASVDRHAENVLNVICNWNINAARDAAWNTAKVLWEIRDNKLATTLMTAGLARTVAMVCRGLLVAV